jgi:hypothetical protein
MKDENQRFNSAMNIINSWQRYDHDAAAKWVAGLDLNEQRRTTLLNMVQKK